MTVEPPTVRLLDDVDGTGRTTVSLLGSLAARLAALHAVSGADTVGSLTAGYAALGRRVAQTADGGRLRAAIERSRAGANGDAIWEQLRIRDWASTLPPAPVLDELRNDLALLAGDDIDAVLALPLAPAEPVGSDAAMLPAPCDFADYLVGMWAFAHEVVRGIDALTAAALDGQEAIRTEPPADGEVLGGPLLR